MYRLLVAAMAMMFSDGCQAMCRIFLVKSRLSTPTSPRRRLPPLYTRRVRSTARGLLLSRQASRVTPRPVSLSNIRKKLLYAPVMITLGRGGRSTWWTKRTQLTPQVFVDLGIKHSQPQCQTVTPTVAELDVRHGGDDLREEGAAPRILGFLKH
ncbi:hypothetical protein EYF80_032037 [Liparis tanakae]|uniref:Secreted protein n=1 Tax=Liparis tanakae TaxID=230148 RepID=A0A4Z2GWD1_9TELE|nr:hypothetical protein EYF80_032037 [Liparis tanakae]